MILVTEPIDGIQNATVVSLGYVSYCEQVFLLSRQRKIFLFFSRSISALVTLDGASNAM
jgi:hypothetical protein